MIEKFDTYVLTDRGFIATKGELVFHCYKNGGMNDTFGVAMYRNGQKHKRASAYAGTSTVRWCREAAIRMLERYT